MTVKEVIEAALIEQNKIEAPTLTVEQYNYFLNKSIDNVLKLNFGYYDINQIQTDKLYPLKKRIILDIDIDNFEATASLNTGDVSSSYSNSNIPVNYTERGIKFVLPDDYWHLLSGQVEFKHKDSASCGKDNSPILRTMKRGTSDLLSASINNVYNMPRVFGRSGPGIIYYEVTDNPMPAIHVPNSNTIPGINNGEIEIVTGLKHNGLTFNKIYFDYIKVYKPVNITQEQLYLDVVAGSDQDTSEVMEFTNSMCRDIIVELSKQIAANAKEADRVQLQQAVGPQDLSAPSQG